MLGDHPPADALDARFTPRGRPTGSSDSGPWAGSRNVRLGDVGILALDVDAACDGDQAWIPPGGRMAHIALSHSRRVC